MASSRAIAIQQEQAAAHLEAAALGLATALDLPPLNLPSHRDAGIATAQRMEAIAAFLEDVTKAVDTGQNTIPKTPRKSRTAQP